MGLVDGTQIDIREDVGVNDEKGAIVQKRGGISDGACGSEDFGFMNGMHGHPKGPALEEIGDPVGQVVGVNNCPITTGLFEAHQNALEKRPSCNRKEGLGGMQGMGPKPISIPCCEDQRFHGVAGVFRSGGEQRHEFLNRGGITIDLLLVFGTGDAVVQEEILRIFEIDLGEGFLVFDFSAFVHALTAG